MNNSKTMEEYIATFPADKQKVLEEMRNAIKSVVPEAGEKIAYGIPTITHNGKNLVHFAAYDGHYAFYPGGEPLDDFKAELAPYETSKGTVRFPIDQPVPYDLIKRITDAVIRNR
jgi:uncharacterized protein YdhG (YjbR/CyaY superfamily)